MQIVNIIETTVESAAKGIMARIGTYLGTLANSLVSYDDNPIMQQYGFASRHHAADGNGCAEGISVRAGNQQFIIASRDFRYQKAIGTLDPGDSVVYAGVDQNAFTGLICKAETGQLMMYAPGEIDSQGTPTTAYTLTMDPEKKQIIITHENGSGVVIAKDTITISSPSGKSGVVVTDTSVIINSQNIILNGNVGVAGQLKVLADTTAASVTAINLNLATPPIVAGTPMQTP